LYTLLSQLNNNYWRHGVRDNRYDAGLASSTEGRFIVTYRLWASHCYDVHLSQSSIVWTNQRAVMLRR